MQKSLNNQHALKHISNVKNFSAAKRLNFMLRWLVRNDNVDVGLWKFIKKQHLYLPLDIHVLNSSLKLGLTKHKNSSWYRVLEITYYLRKFNPEDPIIYDFALFEFDKKN